ncbi:MarR family winged helix-turn-helix transcriptional regulator [Zavarzinia compransoris]|uniref:MarR family transcriptional regulator n=1 Tax=Zavarzinia compransoris TaxID=1264899 RepID=A0A317E0U1_9PROT|nr:MarR family transcriptional regulator [Zavarzinia compransoris]PWR18983.1 MarR family transcriptional regulator [Zavarzinia compransoris]TDP48984.1 DNA-binding MarR family transcriptional regulator [Zavarzinia compransoris]
MAFVSDLTAHTGYWMRMVSNAVSQDFASRLGAEGVTVAEWCVLRALYDEAAVAPSALAEKMGLTRGAISKLADRLQAKGLAERGDHPGDRRGQRLFLSAAGRAKVPVLAAIADRNDADYFGALDPAERESLDRMLKALVDRQRLTRIPLD